MAQEELAGVPWAVERPLRANSCYSACLGAEGLIRFLVSLGFPQAAGAVLGLEYHLSAVEGAGFA